MNNRGVTLADKQEKIDQLNWILSGGKKKEYAAINETLDEARATASGPINESTIGNLAAKVKTKIKEVDLNEGYSQPANVWTGSIAAGGGREKPAPLDPDQITGLLQGKKIPKQATQQKAILNESITPQQLNPALLREALNIDEIKKTLIEEIIRDSKQDILEMIIYEMFAKERMKKIMVEVLNEAKAKKTK